MTDATLLATAATHDSTQLAAYNSKTARIHTEVLPMNEPLRLGDYLCSPSHIFFAVIQGDGNFCVYRGSPEKHSSYLWGSQATSGGGEFFAVLQGDGNFCVYRGTPEKQGAWLWGSQHTSGGGNFFLALQDDGNLCVYKGRNLSEQSSLVWNSGVIDTMKEIVSIVETKYDLEHAKIERHEPTDMYRQVKQNGTSVSQSSTLSFTFKVDETSGWSNTLSVKVGVSATAKASVPLVAEGSVTVSVDVTNTYVSNGSITLSKSFSFSDPVIVPPHQTVESVVTMSRANVEVPYLQRAIFLLNSGARVEGIIKGVYTGSNTYDVMVRTNQIDKDGKVQKSDVKALINGPLI
jgi:Clostridium epsilon toxin ETX/Bacillus mosquitocidal toxin MTX2